MSAITRSTASGTSALLDEIVKTINESTAVPLADPGYREIYYGFLGLAAPLIGVLLCGALVVSALRRDPATLGRAVVGLGVAGLGGALYIGFAQLLVALDNWLAQGIVEVTGQNLTQAITEMAVGFENVAGVQGQIAANMLLIVLMFIMLLAGLILWFVLVLRKIAILVVVAFAPLLIAGYLWAPTRPWVRKATEVLIALVFTKSAIYALFGIGLALLSRGSAQSLSDFVGTVVLLCGACFTPLLMLRLVHFAGNTHLAGDMMGNLRGGVQPVLNRMPQGGGHSGSGRHDMARHQSQAPAPGQASPQPSQATALGPQSTRPGGSGNPKAPDPNAGGTGGGGAAGGGSSGASAAGSGAATRSGAGSGAGAGAGAAAAGPVGATAAGAMVAGEAAANTAKSTGTQAAEAGKAMTPQSSSPRPPPPAGESDPALPGPAAEQPEPHQPSTDEPGDAE